MSRHSLAILAVLFLALNVGGCHLNSSKDYHEVLMPKQTGSVLQRRMQVPGGPEKKTTKKQTEKTEKKEKKETEKARKSEAEPSATPTSPEESTPAPERFR
jgi:hypothetical protein